MFVYMFKFISMYMYMEKHVSLQVQIYFHVHKHVRYCYSRCLITCSEKQRNSEFRTWNTAEFRKPFILEFRGFHTHSDGSSEHGSKKKIRRIP